MRTPFLAATAAIVLVAPSQTAMAQSFLKRLADRALGSVESEAGRAIDSAASTPTEPKAERAPKRAPTARTEARTAATATVPKPSNASATRYTDDIAKPADAEAKRVAYNKFGEAPCNDCEGGIQFDGKPKFEYDAKFSGLYNERAKRIGSWPVGHVHRWQGKGSVGTLTVQSEERIDGFRCRRAVYKLVRQNQSAERPSLICWGLANKSSSTENWHEIY